MHEPFVTWLLSEEPLTPGQRAALEEHLARCAACRALDMGWATARRALSCYPEAPPRPGYLARWQAYRRLKARRRRRSLGLALFAAAGGALVAPALSAALGLTPWGRLTAGLIEGMRWALRMQTLWVVMRALGAALPPLAALPLLAAAGGAGALSVILWAWALACLPQCTTGRVWAR